MPKPNNPPRLLFCTNPRCQEQLNFEKGCWRKWCRSEGKFFGSSAHQCGSPVKANTYSYLYHSQVEEAGGFVFVSKGTAEWHTVSHETGCSSGEFVFIPDSFSTPPHIPVRRKRKQSAKADEDIAPPTKDQVLCGAYTHPFDHLVYLQQAALQSACCSAKKSCLYVTGYRLHS